MLKACGGTHAGDMGMPSISQSQNGNDMPAAPGRVDAAALSFPSEQQAQTAPRFRAGSRVLYDNDGVPVKGTVAKPNATGDVNHHQLVTIAYLSLIPCVCRHELPNPYDICQAAL